MISISIILEYIRKKLSSRHFRQVKKYITYKESVFFNAFRLVINFPEHNKIYLYVGKQSILDCKITFESKAGEVYIGERAFIGQSNIICRSKVEIGDEVFIAWGCWIYDHDSHSVDYRDRQNDLKQQLEDIMSGKNFIENKNWDVVNSKPIVICSNAWIGMNCIILKGVTIGEGAIVGAGSVVTKDVQAWTIVGGNPARTIRSIPIEQRKK